MGTSLPHITSLLIFTSHYFTPCIYYTCPNYLLHIITSLHVFTTHVPTIYSTLLLHSMYLLHMSQLFTLHYYFTPCIYYTCPNYLLYIITSPNIFTTHVPTIYSTLLLHFMYLLHMSQLF